ncbi:MAG TPA: hypothetical protein VE074_14810 [Jatrophihabitantaceae bacterium]|nr:hypothetical protein [Jatrophihabitantaceae bacterium]
MTGTITQPENEFALVPEIAVSVGISPLDAPAVTRKWVNVTTGGHISGVAWNTGPSELVLIHRDEADARSLDRVALLIHRPTVVLDQAGAGRSSGPRASSAQRAARGLAEAVASFAPQARVAAGIGDGARAALALANRREQISTVVLVDAPPADTEPRGGLTVVEVRTDTDRAETAAASEIATALVNALNEGESS